MVLFYYRHIKSTENLNSKFIRDYHDLISNLNTVSGYEIIKQKFWKQLLKFKEKNERIIEDDVLIL